MWCYLIQEICGCKIIKKIFIFNLTLLQFYVQQEFTEWTQIKVGIIISIVLFEDLHYKYAITKSLMFYSRNQRNLCQSLSVSLVSSELIIIVNSNPVTFTQLLFFYLSLRARLIGFHGVSMLPLFLLFHRIFLGGRPYPVTLRGHF